MRKTVIALIIVTVGAAAAGGWLLTAGRSTAETTEPIRTYETAALERRDLVEREDFAGNLIYADPRVLTAGAAGTLVQLMNEGDVARRGDALFTIEETTTRLLYGKVPVWRDFRSGMSDGADVMQLERNLVALGYDPYGAIDVDHEFESATAAAIERWEDQLGVVEDGVLTEAEVAFAPGPVRLGEHQTSVGSTITPGASVATTSSTRRSVALDLPATRREIVNVGKRVTVEVPGGADIKGRISFVGAVVEAPVEQGGDPTIELEIELIGDVATFEQAPVEVTIETSRVKNVVAAPVTALLALAEGGYALELPSGELIPVQLGAFADGWVEVSGDGIDEGTEVVIAP